MTTTHRLEIPPAFWADHADRCVEREVPAAKGRNGRIVVELTDDEVADLHSDAIHYSNPNDFDFDGALGLSMSARATRKAVEAQVADLDTLVEAYRARLKAERLAFEASPEYAAMQAEAEARRAAAAAARAERNAQLAAEEAARLEEARRNPRVRDLKGRAVSHEDLDGKWLVVESVRYDSDCQMFWIGFEGHEPLLLGSTTPFARKNDLFIAVED